MSINCVSFRGHGSETTGSVAHRNNPNPNPCPTCGKPINFKGSDTFVREEKSGVSTAGVIGGLVALTAATIIGLGYAHKTNAFSKLKEGWMKDTIGKLEPASKKCHEWCTTAKTKSTECWNKIKDFFSSKKG